MRVALVKPPNIDSRVRGGGFYAERLYTSLQNISDLKVEWQNFSVNPKTYEKYDLVHFAYFDPFALTLPPVRLTKTVVEIHDLIPLKFPEHFPLGRKAKVIWPVQKRILKSVNAITTLSEASKKDITEITKYPREKIQVVYLAADPAFKRVSDKNYLERIKKKYHLQQKFVLYVGGVNWNKNLITLVIACQKNGVNLVLVGKEFLREDVDFSHSELEPFREVLQIIKNDQRVQRLGFVPTEDLVGIYNLASVYVQPSVYEGFGLPILEAMSCGLPVICGRNSSLPEIAGDAATYADVKDFKDLSIKILEALKFSSSEKSKVAENSIKQSQKFSWQKTAEKTYEVYQNVINEH